MRHGPHQLRTVVFLSMAVALTACASSEAGGGPDPLGTAAANATAPAGAGEAGPTFYADALPAFQRNCVACHRTDGPNVGGITAPMSLASYEEARPWAPLIREAVESGYMPPWGAHQQHQGTFKGERYISDEDKAAILAWVDAGAPAGNPADAPDPLVGETALYGQGQPVNGWWIGEPDLEVAFAEPVHVADEVQDWQPTVQMHLQDEHTQARWVKQAELQPGGPWVHHIVSSHMGVGVPGRGPFTYPEGWGVLLPEDPYVTVNIHYHKTPGPGTAVADMTRAGFKFYEPGEVIDHVVETDLNWTRDFVIPAGHPNYEVTHERPFEEDTYLLSMGPHMHLRGKAMTYELEYPDGSMETLLHVPDYDFNWQFLYEYQEPKLIPAGSTLHMTWWFDNSPGNPHNPDPTADVVYGEETTDEMANARIYFAPVEPRAIVVGEEIPEDVLREAREREDRRRGQIGVEEQGGMTEAGSMRSMEDLDR